MDKPKRKWEVRRALRYGSEHVAFLPTRAKAVNFAIRDIYDHGNVGRIENIVDCVVYYDVHEEIS